MVQKLVKEFITQSHSDRSLPARRNNVNGGDDLLPEHTLIDQPSYIDLERHSAESAGPLSGSTSTDSTSKNLVDVRQTALAIDGHQIFAPRLTPI